MHFRWKWVVSFWQLTFNCAKATAENDDILITQPMPPIYLLQSSRWTWSSRSGTNSKHIKNHKRIVISENVYLWKSNYHFWRRTEYIVSLQKMPSVHEINITWDLLEIVMHLVVVDCSNYSNCCQLFSYVFISKQVLCMCVSNVLEKERGVAHYCGKGGGWHTFSLLLLIQISFFFLWHWVKP